MRNHVAHNSSESFAKYEKALGGILITKPTVTPPVGDFLRSRPTKGAIKDREVLAFLLEKLEKLVCDALEKMPEKATSVSLQN